MRSKLQLLLAIFILCLSMPTVALASDTSDSPASVQSTGADANGNDASATDTSETRKEGTVTDTGNAINDILRDARFNGALSSIAVITNFVDMWFIRFISLVAFFIISAAMLKNACAGAYCANSKFWDKVADAHQKNEAISIASVQGFVTGGGIQQTTVGGVRDFLLGLIPNIKAFTDFDDADIEPKAYFMKAIPQMIACVVIGIFIYNGYYRDTAAKVGDMGSVLIERTLGSVNPSSLIDKVFNTTGWPKFPTEGDPSRQGQLDLAVSKELKSLIATNYTDITSATQKSAVVSRIANAVRGVTDAMSSGIEVGNPFEPTEDGYSYETTNVQSYATAGATSNITGGIITSSSFPFSADNYVVDDVGNINVRLTFDLGELAGPSTDATTGNRYGNVSFTFKKKIADNQAGGSTTTIPGVDKSTGMLSLSSETAEVDKSSITGISVVKSPTQAGKYVIKIEQGATIPVSAWGIKPETLAKCSTTVKSVINGVGAKVDLETSSIVLKDAVEITISEDTPTLRIGYLCSKDNQAITPILSIVIK